MKTNIIIAVLLFSCSGCTPQQSEELTQQQKVQISQEVKAASDSLWARWCRLDAKGTMEYFSDSPEFVALNPDGSQIDFEAYKKMTYGVIDSASALTMTPARETILVLSKDAVVYAFQGKSEILLKSGQRMAFDPYAITFVMKRLARAWKVVLVHQSGTMAVPEVAGNR